MTTATTTTVNGPGPAVKPSTVIAIKDDARAALVKLGYGAKLATDAVERAVQKLEPAAALDDVIKAALAILKPAPAAGGSMPKVGPNPQPMKALPPPAAKKPEKEKPKVVGKMESITVSIPDLLAALHCVAKDETRYYLQGVFLHRTADGFVRAVATDGQRCLIANLYREHKDKPGPKWLDKGVIVPGDGLAARLKLIAKEQDKEHARVKISFGENQPRLEIADDVGVNVFRLAPIDAEYPKYETVTTARWSGEGTMREDWKPTGFRPAYLKAVADVAKALGSDSVQCFDYAGPGGQAQPVLFTFGADAEGVALFLMPIVGPANDKMSEANRLLLAPSIKLTLAALKAHETRNLDAAKKLTGPEKQAALDKAEDFAKRIKAVLANAGSGTVAAALPAPKPATPKPNAIQRAVAGVDKTKLRNVIGSGGKKPPAQKKAAAKKKV